MTTAAGRGTPGPTFFPSATARQEDRRILARLGWRGERGEVTDSAALFWLQEWTRFREPAPPFPLDSRHLNTSLGGEWQRIIFKGPRRIISEGPRRIGMRGDGRIVTMGIEGQWQVVTSTDIGARSGATGAAYVQDDRRLGAHTLLSLGLRLDYHSAYGTSVSPRAGLVYAPRPDWRFTLAIGRTFRGPTFAELYWPFDGFSVGNPSLRPESAWSMDASATWLATPALTLTAVAFWSDVRDLILWVPGSGFVFSPQNIGRARLSGGSLELVGEVGSARVRAAYSLLEAIDLGTGRVLPNRPRHTVSLAVSRSLGPAWGIGVSLVYVGERFADTLNLVPLPAYAVANLHLQWTVDPQLALGLTVQNLFNASYESVQGFPAPGRHVLLQLLRSW